MSKHLFGEILLIEDEPGHALLIRRVLAKLVTNVTHVLTVSEALAKFGSIKPELIISDLQLPDSSGASGVAAVRERYQDTPVIVLTSSRSLTDAIAAMKNGAHDFIVKEFNNDFEDVLGFALNRVAVALKLEAERRSLQGEMNILRIAIENSRDAMAIVERNGVMRYSNKSFKALLRRLGAAEDYLPGLFSDRMSGAKSLQDTALNNIATLPLRAVWNVELGFLTGTDRAYELSISILEDDQGEGRSVCVLWVRDISEEKRREKFQREILSTTSHDLKGPLGAIALSADLLQEYCKPGERSHELALRIGSSAQGAINLIDEFLSARRLQEGTFILKPSPQKVAMLFDELYQNYSTLALPKRIKLNVEVDPELKANVDPLGFARAVGNLLSNAIKFTPVNGTVTLRARHEGQQVVVEVEDTGSGIEQGEVLQIFERFSRLEKHSEVDGSGLGLFVVKCMVKAHDGQIEVQSVLNLGTVFRLTFPDQPPVNDRGELISLDFG